MKVILKETIKGTGKAGDVVTVSDGFARNRLIPKGIAIEATPANIKLLEKNKANLAKQDAESREGAENIAELLKTKKVIIKTKSGEGGKLFGSITSKDLVDAVKEQLEMDIDKKKIELEGPIKQLGTFRVPVKLYHEIKGILVVDVID